MAGVLPSMEQQGGSHLGEPSFLLNGPPLTQNNAPQPQFRNMTQPNSNIPSAPPPSLPIASTPSVTLRHQPRAHAPMPPPPSSNNRGQQQLNNHNGGPLNSSSTPTSLHHHHHHMENNNAQFGRLQQQHQQPNFHQQRSNLPKGHSRTPNGEHNLFFTCVCSSVPLATMAGLVTRTASIGGGGYWQSVLRSC